MYMKIWNNYVRLLLTKLSKKRPFRKKKGERILMNKVSRMYVYKVNGVVYWLILSYFYDANNHGV